MGIVEGGFVDDGSPYNVKILQKKSNYSFHKKDKADSAGYTMLELIVVVFLLGIFLVVSMPSFRQNVLYNPLKSSSRKVIGIVNKVRGEAKKQRKKQVLFLDFDNQKIWYSKAKNNTMDVAAETQNVYSFPENVRLAAVLTKDDVKKETGRFELWISGQGYAEESIIQLKDHLGNTISLFVSTFLPGIKARDGLSDVE